MPRSDGGKTKVKAGVSACLLGERVRWDGDHRRDPLVTKLLGRYFEWVSFCPEAELGMGIPREPVFLAGGAKAPRLTGVRTGEDWTGRMTAFSRRKASALAAAGICGCIFKSRSPSCGVTRVKVFPLKSRGAAWTGRGAFAAEFMRRFPLIPAEEENRLADARVRVNFVARVFAYRRLRILAQRGFSRSGLDRFHARHRFLLLAHSRRHWGMLERLARSADPPRVRGKRYAKIFMQALSVLPTLARQAKVLEEMAELLEGRPSRAAAQRLRAAIQDYRGQRVPLAMPLGLIRRYARQYRIKPLLDQVFLMPEFCGG